MRFYRLDLNLLPTLDMLLTLGSVQATAEQLGLTQPAISGALQRLRHHFDDPLFVPSGRGLRPTAFALSLHPAIKQMLGHASALAVARPGFEPASTTRSFGIMAADYEASVFAAPLLHRLDTVAPMLEVNLSPAVFTVEEALSRQGLHVVIQPDENRDERWPAETLFTDSLVCIAWSGNALLQGRRQVSLDEFSTLRHVVMRPRHRALSRSELFFRERGLTRVAGVYVPNFLLMAEAVTGTQMIGLMQRRLAEKIAARRDIVVMPSPVEMPILSIIMQWRADDQHDAGVMWLLDAMRATARRLVAVTPTWSDGG